MMRGSERGLIARQLSDLLEQDRIGRSSEQLCQQRIFPRAAVRDLVHVRLGVKVRPQNRASNAACVFDLENTLGRDPGPIRDGRLRNSDPAGQLGDAADRANSLLESPVSHGSRCLWSLQSNDGKQEFGWSEGYRHA